jgi:hypothetical protein
MYIPLLCWESLGVALPKRLPPHQPLFLDYTQGSSRPVIGKSWAVWVCSSHAMGHNWWAIRCHWTEWVGRPSTRRLQLVTCQLWTNAVMQCHQKPPTNWIWCKTPHESMQTIKIKIIVKFWKKKLRENLPHFNLDFSLGAFNFFKIYIFHFC